MARVKLSYLALVALLAAELLHAANPKENQQSFASPQEAAQALIDAILSRGDLADYHPAYAARAELCRRLGRLDEARASYAKALALAQQEPVRELLRRQASELDPASKN